MASSQMVRFIEVNIAMMEGMLFGLMKLEVKMTGISGSVNFLY